MKYIRDLDELEEIVEEIEKNYGIREIKLKPLGNSLENDRIFLTKLKKLLKSFDSSWKVYLRDMMVILDRNELKIEDYVITRSLVKIGWDFDKDYLQKKLLEEFQK